MSFGLCGQKYNVVSLFSGAGGMDIGFLQADYDVTWANDFNKDAVATYRRNIGEHITYGDISSIPSEEIAKGKQVDVVIGGFPCQGFSIANSKRSMKDKRNFLYLEMLRVIDDLKPKFFIAENVKGLLSMEKGEVLKMIIKDFEALGYKVDYRVLNASHYGVPQARERVFIMGNRCGLDNPFPVETHGAGLKPLITVSDAIGHLADIEVVNGKISDTIIVNGKRVFNHLAHQNVGEMVKVRKHAIEQADICDYLKYWRDKSGWTTKKIDDYLGYKHTAGHWFRKDNGCGSIPKPKDWWALKELLGFDDVYDERVTTFIKKPNTFEQSLRVCNWDRPSDTITASSPEIHINLERRLSVRECAILQTFPDDFIFTGSLSSQHRQVGNAVPVMLARQIADTIKCKLDNN